MQVIPLFPRSGSRENAIDPSAYYVRTMNGVRILVDFGMTQERHFDPATTSMSERAVLPEYPPLPPHYIILTHAHIDHIGGFPLLNQKYPEARLVTTKPTFEIARIVWTDLRKIAVERETPGLVPFSHKIYDEVGKRSILIETPGWTNLGRDVSVYFGPNGHMRGSAFIVIEADGTRIMFSGDVSVNDTPTVKGLGQDDFKVLRDKQIRDLFLESTYGGRNIPSRDEEVIKGLNAIRETFARGGKVLKVALAVGRAQEVLIDEASRMNGGAVYLDSAMASEIWHLFADENRSHWSPHDIPIPPSLLAHESSLRRVVHLSEVADRNYREKILGDNHPYLIVASAGALQGGNSARWAKRILPDSKNLVILCNYQFEGTPGAALESIERGGTLYFKDGESVKVEADVLRLELSGHAGHDQLVSIAKWVDAKHTYPCHGTPRAQKALRVALRRAGIRTEKLSKLKRNPLSIPTQA